MGRTAGRSAEQTRSAIIAAASRLIAERGVRVSLDAIARAADVSKGGLIYHFSSKDDLFLAIVRSFCHGFRDRVMEHADREGDVPGRLTRAYVNVSLDPDVLNGEERIRLVVIGQLMSIPEVADLAAEDARRWERDLGEDGVSPDVQQIVISASDGAEGALLWGDAPGAEALQRLRSGLLGLIERDLSDRRAG